MRVGIIGLDRQRFLKLSDCVVELPAGGVGIAKVVVGLGIIRLEFQGLLIPGQCRIEFPPAQQCNLLSAHLALIVFEFPGRTNSAAVVLGR
jgi:hypothetical protein